MRKERNMSRWILTLLLIAGIAVGQQKKVIIKKKTLHKGDKEQIVDVDVETDGDEMTIIITQDGEEKEYTIDMDDQTALKEVKEKLADMDVNIKNMVFADDNVFKIHSGGYLGVQIQELTDGLRKYFKVNNDNGVLISEVVEDSPAEKAKLKAGDIILSVNGDNVSTTSDLQQAISRQDTESEVKLEVIRKGRKKDMTATLGSQKSNFSWTGKMPPMKMGDEDHNVFLFSPDDNDSNLQSFHMKNHFKAQAKHLEKKAKKLKKSGEKLHKEYKFRMAGPNHDDNLREELDELKKELKKLRKEINKLKKS
ncbi:MAG: PDZ domain-containing protein [Candidatus Marinimicrobia bacterium]|nr:PDZ domain-containing protein [Candidatus Neomarinimicrobiota bacterium]